MTVRHKIWSESTTQKRTNDFRIHNLTRSNQLVALSSRLFVTSILLNSHLCHQLCCSGKLGKWIAPGDLQDAIAERFPGCMKGRTMYVVPFSMGPIGGPISKNGIELTDSAYVVVSMNIMTRMNKSVLNEIGESDDFVKCLHSVGCPLPLKRELTNNWPCNPEQVNRVKL